MDHPDSINVLALLAERKIREAMAEGRFDNLPGRGRPQTLEDLSHLPEDLRLVYLVLKNSGHLEAEPAGALNFNDLLARAGGDARDCGRLERLKFQLARARRLGGRPAKSEPEDDPVLNPEYLGQLLDRM